MYLYSLLSTYAVEAFEPVAKWLTIGLFAALLIGGAVLFFCKRSAFAKFVKGALLGAFVYLLALAVLFFALDIAKNYSDSYAEKNWLDKRMLVKFVLVPLLVFSALCLIGTLTYAVGAKRFPERKKPIAIVCLSVCALALVAVIVCIAVYYRKKIVDDGYYNSDSASVKQFALYISAIGAVLLIVGLALTDKNKLSFDARALALAGICAAMSFALSYIKLWDMPAGGSVTLVSLLPVMLYAYIFGAKRGVFVGFVYGVLQAVQDPWLIHPAQFLLDYPVAFSAAGLAGLFRKNAAIGSYARLKFAVGAFAAGTARFLCHVLSGALAFEAYAEGQNAWLYSLGYNAYVFIDVALVVAAGIFVLSSKAFLKEMTRYAA